MARKLSDQTTKQQISSLKIRKYSHFNIIAIYLERLPMFLTFKWQFKKSSKNDKNLHIFFSYIINYKIIAGSYIVTMHVTKFYNAQGDYLE